MDDPIPWLAVLLAWRRPRRELHALLVESGSPEALLRAGRVPGDLALARAEGERVQRAGLRLLTPRDPAFPAALREIPDPPLLLWSRGELPSGPTLAMVSSRRATARGLATARAFARELAAAGAWVVSGLAYGIDAAAHEGALEAGRTLAVLASGLERASPVGNRKLARRILDGGGGWLSEYPTATPALARHFPERNRLISGLAQLSLIVEAREASGTLWTARHAMEQGRAVMAVPGPIDSAAYRGSNSLLRDGAGVALASDDLLTSLSLESRLVASSPPPSAPLGARSGTGALPERILLLLEEGPTDGDTLQRALGASAAELSGALLELELAGRIAREGSRLSRPPR